MGIHKTYEHLGPEDTLKDKDFAQLISSAHY
jgi:hypothetical protein